ncbi:MAG: DNA-binding protein [Nitrosopumilus sp.]|uniref:DNA-binding protein n=1 Tax=Nitrosopumilus sp. TaxID=2024843 RepID=UPI002930E874|nr:DNA-binding protein [Nitrosopumilus sp.]
MSEDDIELERLKAKRLAEMQKNISSNRETEKPVDSSEEKLSENPRDLLVKKLGFRGLEVLENAESQFPNESKIVVEKLAELIKTGEVGEILDGGKLLTLFRSIGLSIRMQTKINVEQDGKFVSLTDKLRNQTSNDGDKQ